MSSVARVEKLLVQFSRNIFRLVLTCKSFVLINYTQKLQVAQVVMQLEIWWNLLLSKYWINSSDHEVLFYYTILPHYPWHNTLFQFATQNILFVSQPPGKSNCFANDYIGQQTTDLVFSVIIPLFFFSHCNRSSFMQNNYNGQIAVDFLHT